MFGICGRVGIDGRLFIPPPEPPIEGRLGIGRLTEGRELDMCGTLVGRGIGRAPPPMPPGIPPWKPPPPPPARIPPPPPM
jgi:hypothetical protein